MAATKKQKTEVDLEARWREVVAHLCHSIRSAKGQEYAGTSYSLMMARTVLVSINAELNRRMKAKVNA